MTGWMTSGRSLTASARVLPGAYCFAPARWGVGDRCAYVPGDMFREVPQADAYLMKRILHDWDDAECRQILATLHRAAPPDVVPGVQDAGGRGGREGLGRTECWWGVNRAFTNGPFCRAPG